MYRLVTKTTSSHVGDFTSLNTQMRNERKKVNASGAANENINAQIQAIRSAVAAMKMNETFDITAVPSMTTKTNKYVKILNTLSTTPSFDQLAADPVARFDGGS
uniref:Uncharacterized protein n=1 Tax=Glossina austeni TaxID=7395 RepID=A0A1A9UJK0_GLOAU